TRWLMGERMRRIVHIMLAVVVTVMSNTVFANDVEHQSTSPSQENARMNSSELETRGKQLRASMDVRYKELIAAGGALNSREIIFQSVDLTDLFTPYIPIGMSFDDAEVVLRAAGFSVGPSKLPEIPDALVGSFSYVRDMNWFITVGFMARPDTPNGRKVGRSEGGITKQRH
ncbi:MAG: hypothetical protein WCA63_09545, partial [Gallionella sp.]